MQVPDSTRKAGGGDNMVLAEELLAGLGNETRNCPEGAKRFARKKCGT
jgi:hypothetical protein